MIRAQSLSRGRRPAQRAGVAAVEFAVILPILVMLFAIGVDYSRIYFHYVTVNNCARNGALYKFDPRFAAESSYGSFEEAALADASDLSPQPTVTSQEGTDSAGHPYVQVTVSYPFTPVTSYLGLGNTVNVTRTVQIRKAPLVPNSPSPP